MLRRSRVLTAILLLALMGSAPAYAQQPVQQPVELYPMKKGDQWGYIDAEGAWAISPQFNAAQPFSEGLAGAQKEPGGPWGFINTEGEWVIAPQFQHPQARAYARMEGSHRVPAAVDPFSNGLAPVLKDGKLVMIDKNGVVQITGDGYSGLWGFAGNGLARVQKDGKYGFIDRSGEMVIEPQFEAAGDFSDGLAAVKRSEGFDAEWGYIDASGQMVIEEQFEEAGRFSGGLAPAATSPWDWMYINTEGKQAFEQTFAEARPFSDGLAVVEDEDGWYYITTDGTVASRQTADGRPFCYAFSFRAGRARVYIPPKGESCRGYMTSGSYVQVPNGLMAYIDREGRIIYQQPLAELRARQARQDSLQAAEAAREQRREQREARQERQRLAGCADFVAYGDTTLPNMIEIGYKGVVRRFYFKDAAVEVWGDRTFTVTVPGFRLADERMIATGINVGDIRIEPDFMDRSKLDVLVRGYLTSGSGFCIEFPEAVADDFDSSGRIAIHEWTPPSGGASGVWEATVTVTSDEDSTSYLKGRFHITDIFMPSENEPVADPGFYRDDEERKAISEVTFTHNPGEESLRAKVHLAGGAFVYDGIPNFDGTTGLYVEEGGDSFDEETEFYWLYDVVAFSDAFVHYKKYRVEAPTTQPDKLSFFPETSPRAEDFSVSDGVLVADVRSTHLRRAPHIEDVFYGEGGRLLPPGRQREPGSLALEDFSESTRPAFRQVEPYDLSYAVHAGGRALRYVETASTTLQHAGQYALRIRSAGAPEGASGRRQVDELARLMKQGKAAQERYQATGDLAAYKNAVMALFDRYDIAYAEKQMDTASTHDAVMQIVEPAVREAYPREVFAQLEQREGARDQNALLPVTLRLDAKTGLPVRSRRVLPFGPAGDSTTITIEYRDGKALVTAENEQQGRQQRAFPMPEGTLALFQLRHSLAFLPLEEGYRQTLALFDLDVSEHYSASYSSSGGSESSRYVVIRPIYSKASLRVEGVDQITAGDEPVEAYRVRVRFEGQPSHLPGLAPIMAQQADWPLEATYYLRRQAPHRLLRVTYPGGARLEAVPD